jgi:predicted kinase
VLECVILVGLPGAGKTTFFRRYFAATHQHVSKDLVPATQRRGARQRQLVETALARGQSVVIDNTNPSREERKVFIDLAHARGARVVGYFLDVSIREAVARNDERTGSGKVPRVAIFTIAKRLERPDLAEGFDHVFRVRPGAGGTFAVTEVR